MLIILVYTTLPQVRLRRILIDMVLATDMKQHFNFLSKFQAKLQVKLRSTNFSSATHLETPTHDDPLPISEDDADKSLILQVSRQGGGKG